MTLGMDHVIVVIKGDITDKKLLKKLQKSQLQKQQRRRQLPEELLRKKQLQKYTFSSWVKKSMQKMF